MYTTHSHLLLVVASAPLFAGCSGGSDTAAGARDEILSAGCDAIALTPPEKGVQLKLPISLAAGEEGEFCQLVRADQALNISSSDGLFTSGSHHGLVHKTSYKGAFPTETVDGKPFDGDPSKPHRCLTPAALWDVRGVIANGRNVVHRDDPSSNALRAGVLPDNVALRVEADDILVLNFHMINTTGGDIDACYKVNLNSIDASQVEQEAGVFFLYNPFITVPASSSASAKMACPVTDNVTLLSAVSHMHSRGVGSHAQLWNKSPAEAGAEPITMLYDLPEWSEPKATEYAPPVSLTTGQWIDWSCDYTNPEDHNVAQGFATTDEMCMFIGLYYPRSIELERCGQVGFDKGLMFGNGSKNGLDFLSCFAALSGKLTLFGALDDPNRYDTLSCFTQTCPKASPPLNPYLTCLVQKGGPAACTTEQAAVEAATCD